ncbi:hypothetical protein HPB49_008017 [Dermacentor silvarum]|uniref:Uncharacterized protein n=1 Tax=Dermacentor silvarum TaxID=543639 RepID=A0ACB8D3Z7_DERSI|nr:hypothetical protein HPB49_008017 [Dermacentor silvarum]
MQYCHKCGFTFLGGLVNDWPSYLSKDGVHPSRFGNKVLADYLYQEACTLFIHLERCRIQQCYKEIQAPSSWTGRTRQDSIPAISEADFPPLGLHIFISSQAASGPSTAPAPVWKASTAPLQRHDTNQPTRTLQGAGFSLVGSVRVRVARVARLGGPGTSLPSPLFHGTSVPSRGKAEGRSHKPMIPGRGASTTCVRRTRRATQKHESAPVVCSSVGEGEASAREAAVPEAVSQCGDSEWKLVVSKRRRRKAAALHKK